MKKIPNEKFKAELEEIRPFLPKRYMSVINHLYPGLYNKVKIYNVLHHGVENNKILAVLKRISKPEKSQFDKKDLICENK